MSREIYENIIGFLFDMNKVLYIIKRITQPIGAYDMLKEIVKTEVMMAIEIARSKFPERNIPMPKVEFSNRMTVCAGKCRMGSSLKPYAVIFSLPIIQDNSIGSFADETVYHEVAHMVDHIIYGGWGHGNSFYHVLHNILERPRSYGRCHSFKVRRRKKVHIYYCPDCGSTVTVSSIIHGKIQRGQKRWHKGCHSRLQCISEKNEN